MSFIFETKYLLPERMLNLARATLSHRTAAAADFPASRLRTVYFDDRNDRSYQDKRDGQLQRMKYRFREYVGTTKGAFYSLEVKIKEGAATRKLKRLIYTKLPQRYSPTTFRELVLVLEQLSASQFPEFHFVSERGELSPDTWVLYDRMRFEDNRSNARFNLDLNIRAGNCGRMTAADGTGVGLGHAILEIKTARAEFFPPFLSGLELKPFSFSKYAWGKGQSADYAEYSE